MMAFAFVLTMLLLPLEATEPSAQEAFDKGCELYLAGEYQRAVDVYVEGKVLDENPGLYYYNLGICAFRMDRGLPSDLADDVEGLLRRLDALRFNAEEAKELSEKLR
ncbi:MAG: hypothetical protein ACYTG7_21935, partial [Planctomycetota bacterium]